MSKIQIKKILVLWQMRWRDKGLLGLTALLLLLTRLVFLFLPFSLFRRYFRSVIRRQGDKVIDQEPGADRILWAVEAASRYLPITQHCLTRAVVAKMLLNQLGFQVDFQIGVYRTKTGELCAHAWLESEGRVILGRLSDLNHYCSFSGLH